MGFKVASRVRGLSDEAFREAFGAEEQCRSALSRLRWPDGFVCPACGHRGHCVLAGRSLYQCYRCKKQTSSTAGTIFHATKLPLTLWFAASVGSFTTLQVQDANGLHKYINSEGKKWLAPFSGHYDKLGPQKINSSFSFSWIS